MKTDNAQDEWLDVKKHTYADNPTYQSTDGIVREKTIASDVPVTHA